MIRFRHCGWSEMLRPWLVSAGLTQADIDDIPGRLERCDCLLLAAGESEEDLSGVILASVDGDTLRIEAVAGGAGVMRSAMDWSKAEVKRRGLRHAVTLTASPAVVYHMARAGARLNAALLTWEP